MTAPSAQRLPRNFFDGAQPFKLGSVYCKLIPLTQGLVSIVWEDDYRWLSAYRWHARKDYRTGKFYAQRYGGKKRGEPQRCMALHRQILGLPWDSSEASGDHRDPMDTLDNRRANLRDADASQQQYNKGRQKNNTSGFKNVVYEPQRKAYKAMLQTNVVRKNLGRRKTAEEAFALVCEATIQQHGQFARTA